jgi:hypothetical protein
MNLNHGTSACLIVALVVSGSIGFVLGVVRQLCLHWTGIEIEFLSLSHWDYWKYIFATTDSQLSPLVFFVVLYILSFFSLLLIV